MFLSKEEQLRYQRHLILPGFGEEAQLKLKKASILVIGAGGLGCPALLYLASTGFGRIGIVDDDTVSESNLHRQVLFNNQDIGKSKARMAKEKLSLTNPLIRIDTFETRLTSENILTVMSEYDIIMDGTDNFNTRYLVNDACVMTGKPLVSGSIFTFEGQVSVFNYQNGPTYRCLFPEPPSSEEMPNCSEIGVLGVLPGVIGTIMATEAVKLATGSGDVLSGKLLVYDALKMDFHKLEFEAKEENRRINKLPETDFSCEIIKDISIEDYKRKQASEDLTLIDVRERHEFDLFNIGGENIPLSELEENVHRIAKDKMVVIHCKSGGRSRKAISLLQQKYGFENLYNLQNGLTGW